MQNRTQITRIFRMNADKKITVYKNLPVAAAELVEAIAVHIRRLRQAQATAAAVLTIATNLLLTVIPAKAGIHALDVMDSCLRRNDRGKYVLYSGVF